jgi:hypothetical protein
MDAVPDNCDDNSLCSFHPPCLEKTRFFTGLLVAPFWTNLDFVIVATATNAMTDIPITGEAKFYRIVETN